MFERLQEIISYIIIGLVQGIGEILPISSSGHLVIVQNILGIKNDDLVVEILLHLASLIALLIYFRKEIINLVIGFINYVFKRQDKDKKYFAWGIKIVIASIPAAIVGILFEEYITGIFSSLLSVGISLLVTSLLVLYISNRKGNKKIEEISYLSSFVIGIFQAVAILPGISRSGATIAGGKTQSLDKEDASLFAFMLFIPASFGAFILKLEDLGSMISKDANMLLLLSISFITTIIASYFSLKLIFNLIRQGKIRYFAYYLIVAGVFTIIYSIIK